MILSEKDNVYSCHSRRRHKNLLRAGEGECVNYRLGGGDTANYCEEEKEGRNFFHLQEDLRIV